MSLLSYLHRLSGLLPLTVAVGCGSAASPRGAPQTSSAMTVAPAVVLRGSDILPIYVEDLSLGSQSAPVTLVAFLDLECPYCAKAWETIVRIQKRFGPEQLRVVVKHLPLPFHAQAAIAARHLLEVQRSHGESAALAFLNRVFQGQSQLSEIALRAWAIQSVPTKGGTMSTRVFSLSIEDQVHRDALLASRLGIDGTPEFRINGISLLGALADAEFERVISLELAAVEQLTRTGMPPGDVYASRVATNHQTTGPDTAAPAEPDSTRWAIPLGNSPQLGPPTAPVTIVAFMDYECPFCRRGFETIKQLRARYADKLRIVWKHRPLDFHERARAASSLAIFVRKLHGEDAFWSVTDQLLARQENLSELASLPILATFGIDPLALQNPAAEKEREAVLATDSDLADDFNVEGTPQFFVNGWRVKGARPIEEFSELIDRELTLAASLREKGTREADLFAALTTEARPAPEPVSIAEGTSFPDGPSTGPNRARVTIRVFSDYQCPFCQRAESTVNELLKKYPADVRVVWYDLPLGLHDRARAAATLAREVRAQRGDKAFFRINHLLFEKQADLAETALIGYAKTLGLREDTLLEARREHTHGPGIDRDLKLADDLHISGTPTFIVERYLLEGAQPASRFERLIRRVLVEKPTPRAKSGNK